MIILKNLITNKSINLSLYNQFLALDWSEEKMVLARMNKQASRAHVKVWPTDLKRLKEYLLKMNGNKILTIEETTTTHWLYVEIKDCVDKILVCDPYTNSLLKQGPKTDKIDAGKLCMLLRSGLLKEVYHSNDESYKIRKLVSSYEDLVKAGVRVKNQQSALFRGLGLKYKKDVVSRKDGMMKFVEEFQNRSIELYHEEKKKFESMFRKLEKENKTIRRLTDISGIGTNSAVTIFSTVIDAKRFESKYKYWSYCGLVYNEKESGGRIYGKRRPRHSRKLKSIYKTAAVAAISGNNDIGQYYDYLLQTGMEISKARSAIARYIAKVSYAVMKSGKNYRPYQWREAIETN